MARFVAAQLMSLDSNLIKLVKIVGRPEFSSELGRAVTARISAGSSGPARRLRLYYHINLILSYQLNHVIFQGTLQSSSKRSFFSIQTEFGLALFWDS